jgi:U2 small nuclear ribonucleoprotein A'
MIENLGITRDEYEVIDLSDNSIVKLDNLPLLKQLTGLYLHNNNIVKIENNLGASVPNLSTLLLNHNKLSTFQVLKPLNSLSTSLTHVSLVGNPVTAIQHYRLYMLYLLPNLQVLDHCKVKQGERDAAVRTYGVDGKSSSSSSSTSTGQELSTEQRALIQQQLVEATSIEEVSRLEQLLQLNNGQMELDED